MTTVPMLAPAKTQPSHGLLRRIATRIGGTLLVLLLVVALVSGVGEWRYNRSIDQEIAALLARQAAAPQGDGVITAAMLTPLPAPVQRYLRYVGVVDKPFLHTVRLEQAGKFRMQVDGPWLDFHATQVYTVDQPGMLWDATFTQGGLPVFRVRDRYMDAHGEIRATVGGLFTAMQRSGPEIDQGTMLRYLNELVMWFPAAVFQPSIGFTAVDDTTALIHFTHQGQTVTATLIVDDEGKLINFIADRFNDSEQAMLPWHTPISGYAQVDGVLLAHQGRGVWKMAQGDFAYVDLTVTHIAYNAR